MIFISYRRADSESVVGRIYSELKKHFPTQEVFLDHDSIPLGKLFLDVIRERLATSKFAIVLIGPKWHSIADEKTGQRRLDDPNDFVRLEVETALATTGIDVIPLWVMRANSSPEEIEALPKSLQALFKFNGMSLRPVPDEESDIQRLIGKLAIQLDSSFSNGSDIFEGKQFRPHSESRFGRATTSHEHTSGDSLEIKRKSIVRYSFKPSLKGNRGPIIGIDFGTSNSFAAIVESGEVRLVPNRFGYLSTPSAVYVQPDGTVVVGEPAVSMSLRDPQHGVLHVKRLFGTNRELIAYGRTYSASQLACEVLKVLRMDCEIALGTDCQEAVVGIPAYYLEAQKDDLREACALAGIKVARFVDEPSAACIGASSYFDRSQHASRDQLVAVIDLGGGTFDVSILDTAVVDDSRVIEVIALGGDCFLGGIDYDQAIIDYCFEQFHFRTGISLFGNLTASMRLRDAAERAKIELSSSEHTTVFVPYVFANASGSFDLNVPISRSGFNGLTEHLTAKIVDCCRRTLVASEYPKVDCLIMIGLSTRTPSIRERTEELFGIKAISVTDPDTAVAIGTGVQASVLNGANRQLLLLPVTPHCFGIEILGGIFSVLVDWNSKIPVEKRGQFKTVNRNQDCVLIRVWQGNQKIAKDNLLLCQFFFNQVTPSENEKALILVKIDIDQNGLVQVYVEDSASGRNRMVDVFGDPTFEEIDGIHPDSFAIEEVVVVDEG